MADDADRLDDLVAAFQAGDREAFRDLVAATELELRACAATYAPDLDLVDEVVQMTYVVAFRKIAAYRGPGAFRGWLKGIARNRLREEFRQRNRLRTVDIGRIDRLLQERGEHLLAETARAEAEERAFDLARLDGCLDRLPDGSRCILDRRYRDGRRIAELACEFGKTPAAMAKTVQRLVAALRRCLAGEGTP